MKLYGGNDTAGVVQVYHDDKWGTICDDGWDNMDARYDTYIGSQWGQMFHFVSGNKVMSK